MKLPSVSALEKEAARTAEAKAAVMTFSATR